MSKVDEDKFKDYTDKVLGDLKIKHKEFMGAPNQSNNKLFSKNFSKAHINSVSIIIHYV